MTEKSKNVIAKNDYIKIYHEKEIFYRDSLRSSFNRSIISGILQHEYRYSHTSSCGEEFYENVVLVQNVDGRKNFIPILVPERIAGRHDCFMKGKYVRVGGQLRSFRTEHKLKLFLFSNEIEIFKFPKDEDFNSIILKGKIFKYLNIFPLLSGVTNVDLILRVNRNYGGKEDYLPCTMSAPSAAIFNSLCEDTELEIEGWIRSRIVEKKGTPTKKVYEVVMSEVRLPIRA